MTWEEAVIAIKSWYERNINEYNQSGFKDSGELGVGKVREDCSGFVSACLRKAGFVPMSFITSSHGILANGYDANKLKAAGFVPLAYDINKAKPFDILVRAGHTEIYAGNKKSYNWGSVHNLAKGGMPSATSHLKEGYTIMWRLPSVGNEIPPDVQYATNISEPTSNGPFSSSTYSSSSGIFSNSPNKVYQLASKGERDDVLKLDDGQKAQYEALRTSLMSEMVNMGRDVIKSTELYNSSIMKTSQTAKQIRS